MTDLSPLRFLTSTVTDTQSCHIFMGSIRELQFFLVQNHPRIVVIIDEGVLDIWRTELQSLLDHRGLVTLTVIPISEGESSKQLPEFLRVIDLLQNVPVNRRDALLIVGGGSCCDLGGTVATTFMRGIPYILVPTTLMAMVDAALGGKVAINLPSAKNLFGGFHTPVAVWVDIDFLSTLPGREIRQAFGEMIKLAVIADDPQFFTTLESFIPIVAVQPSNREPLRCLIEYSIKNKLRLVERDWKEQDLNRLLNAGHEVAHSLEATFGFDRAKLAHGEAVALGLAAAARFSYARGFIASQDSLRIIQLLKHFGLPTSVKLSSVEFDKVLVALDVQQRVRNGALRLVLPELPYRSFIYHGEDSWGVLDYLKDSINGKPE